MSKWYRVEIHGHYGRQPLTVAALVPALDEAYAAMAAVASHWPFEETDYDYIRGPLDGRRVIRFLVGARQQGFVTGYSDFGPMATEIVDAAELARLDGHPMLPFALAIEEDCQRLPAKAGSLSPALPHRPSQATTRMARHPRRKAG